MEWFGLPWWLAALIIVWFGAVLVHITPTEGD